MKKTLLFSVFLIFSIHQINAQLHRNDKYALDRVSIHRWNKFKPWWLFKFVFPKYKKGDKRMVPQQALLLATTAITEVHTRKEKENFDTIARHAEIQALDKISNLSWHLFYKDEIEELEKQAQHVIAEISETGASPQEIIIYQTFLALTKEGLYIVLDSFIKDADKREAIIRYKSAIEAFLLDLKTSRDLMKILVKRQDVIQMKEDLQHLRKLYIPEEN